MDNLNNYHQHTKLLEEIRDRCMHLQIKQNVMSERLDTFIDTTQTRQEKQDKAMDKLSGKVWGMLFIWVTVLFFTVISFL